MDIQMLASAFYDHSFYIRGYSKQTIRRYRQLINFYCTSEGIRTIDQVTDSSIRQFFFKGRTQRNWKPISFITYRDTLMVFFKWCVKKGYLPQNPVDDMETPKVEKRLRPKLTKQQALRLLEVSYNYPFRNRFLRSRNHAILATFIFAGLRRRELLNLRMTDVDLENLTLFVNQGKGAKDRIIPITYTLAQSLNRYLCERKIKNKVCPEFFASSSRNMGVTISAIDGLVDIMIASSGIAFSVHKLRHTFATLMLEGGCDIYSLSKMMGHSDIKTTTIYLAASAEHLRFQIKKHPLNNLEHERSASGIQTWKIKRKDTP